MFLEASRTWPLYPMCEYGHVYACVPMGMCTCSCISVGMCGHVGYFYVGLLALASIHLVGSTYTLFMREGLKLEMAMVSFLRMKMMIIMMVIKSLLKKSNHNSKT